MDEDSQVEPTTDEAASKPDGSEKESTQVMFKRYKNTNSDLENKLHAYQ